jgi:hypothetical protein
VKEDNISFCPLLLLGGDKQLFWLHIKPTFCVNCLLGKRTQMNEVPKYLTFFYFNPWVVTAGYEAEIRLARGDPVALCMPTKRSDGVKIANVWL